MRRRQAFEGEKFILIIELQKLPLSLSSTLWASHEPHQILAQQAFQLGSHEVFLRFISCLRTCKGEGRAHRGSGSWDRRGTAQLQTN